MTPSFRDRRDAGEVLAAKLGAYAGRDDVIVLALPRGGVPVAYEVARALGAPLDVFTVRKLGVPGHEEWAFGAIASGGVRVLDHDLVGRLGLAASLIDRITARERRELERRERAYRGDRPAPALTGRTVIVVDDGLATGSTMRAAVQALRALGPRQIVVAVPTGARQTCDQLRPHVDALVCATMPEPFHAVGQQYEDFSSTTDEEVCRLLAAGEPVPGRCDGGRPATNVEDIMTADVITVRPETSVHKAARLMSDHGVSGLPVVDVDGRVLGLVTEGDLILRQAAPRATHWWRRFFADPEALAREYQKAAGTMVGEIMTREVVSIGPALDIASAARTLHDRGFRRLPVVHEGRLVGILSRGDLVKALAATPVATTSVSDDELVAAMQTRMKAEPWTPFGAVVEASDSVITLRGVVFTETERSALETMARAIPGCRDVDNQLIAGMGLVHGLPVV